MKQILIFLAAMLFCCCSADNEAKAEVPTMNQIYITIGGQTQSVTLVDNDATHELVAALQNAPITVTLNDNNFEIWGPLGRSLTTNNEQMTAQPGDIVLYNGSNICIFLPTREIFSTSFPAAFAPSTNLSANMSLFDPRRRLVEITITFFIVF